MVWNGLYWKWTCKMLNQQNMWPTVIWAEFSTTIEMAAIACNESQQHCDDSVHQNFRIFTCCCWVKRFNRQWIYHAVHWTWPITLQAKTRHELNAAGKLYKPGFSCMDSRTENMLRDCQTFSCGRAYSLVIVYSILKIRFCSWAHVCPLQQS